MSLLTQQQRQTGQFLRLRRCMMDTRRRMSEMRLPHRSRSAAPHAITAWRASSIDERAEHGLDHGFDGRIIDALGLRQFGRDCFEIAVACRWRQLHRSLAHDRELTVGLAQNAIGFSKVHRGQTPVQLKMCAASP